MVLQARVPVLACPKEGLHGIGATPDLSERPRVTLDALPIGSLQEQKYTVYKELHDRGYWLSSGVKFGGEFLVFVDRFIIPVASVCDPYAA
jgi:hypothetical protein